MVFSGYNYILIRNKEMKTQSVIGIKWKLKWLESIKSLPKGTDQTISSNERTKRDNQVDYPTSMGLLYHNNLWQKV